MQLGLPDQLCWQRRTRSRHFCAVFAVEPFANGPVNRPTDRGSKHVARHSGPSGTFARPSTTTIRIALVTAESSNGQKDRENGRVYRRERAGIADKWEIKIPRLYLTGREPVMRISTSLFALCCQSGLDATLETPMSARSRSNGSRSLRISPLLIARFTSASIAPLI